MQTKDSHTHTHTLPNPSLDIPIFTKLYDFYKNLYLALNLFPKRDRYSLGQKLDNIVLEIFEQISKISLVSKEQKIETLQSISTKLDLLKILLRFSHDNKSLNTKTYLSLEEQLQEIGKMAGGWLRYFKNS